MTSKNSKETPRSSSPIDLIADLMKAISESPEASQRLQSLLSPIPTLMSPLSPASDLLTNIRIIASVHGTTADAMLSIYPDLGSTHRWFDGIRLLIGKIPLYPAAAFSAWVHAALVIDNAAQAQYLLDAFILKHPWAIYLTGSMPNDPNYGALLLQYQGLSQATLPTLPDNSHAIQIIELFQKASLYYTNHGKLSLESLFGSHLAVLKLRIDDVKYPQYDSELHDSRYHIAWIYYINFHKLSTNKHTVISHILTFRQSKVLSPTLTEELATRSKYIADFKIFLQSFESVWPDQASAFAALKKPFVENFAYPSVQTYIVNISNDCTTMNELLKLTLRLEDAISQCIKFPKLPPAAGGPSTGHVSPAPAAGATSTRPEGRKAHAAALKTKKSRPSDAFCTNPSCTINGFVQLIMGNTFSCNMPCMIPECLAEPSRKPHKAKSCMLIRCDNPDEYLKAFEV